MKARSTDRSGSRDDTADANRRRLRPHDVVSRNMSRIRAGDTKIERMVRSALWRRGYRFRKHYRAVPGNPDVVFTRQRVAVFCDSDFWHGRNWPQLMKRLTTNPDYWLPKIRRNRERDRKVTAQLHEMGWEVLRFWETDILAGLDTCVAEIVRIVESRKRNLE